MAYNVFKRPMFKRGGATTGTGIMSHVEPRVKAAMGFPNFGVRQGDNTGYQEYMNKVRADRAAKSNNPNQGFLGKYILGPRFTDPNFQTPFENFFSSNTGFGFLNFGVPGDGSGITANFKETPEKTVVVPEGAAGKSGVEIGLQGEDGITNYEYGTDEIIKQVADIESGIAQLEKEGLYDTTYKKKKSPKEKDTPKYEGTDLKSEIEKEAKLIKDLLKDEGYSKGELALLIAGAVKEPGGISEKLDKARELAIPIARKRKDEDKAITLAAYKFAKEKEREEIKAAGKKKDTQYIQNIEATAEAMANAPGETRSKEEIKRELLAAAGKEKDATYQARLKTLSDARISGSVLDAVGDIEKFRNELATAKTEKDRKRIQEDIQRKISQISPLLGYPEFDSIFPGIRKRLGLKEGGRVKYAEGTGPDDVDVEDDIITSKVSFGSGSATTSEPVEQLTYEQLRDRLPPEITDDVVNLLANNAEALQQFAYITTQDDVNNFNIKYGVNLVIPPTRT